MAITDIKNLAKALFKGREREIDKNQNFCLNLGRIEARLDTKARRISFGTSGRSTFVASPESSWRNARGKFLLKPSEEPNPHILITGMSGYGKSTLCKLLIKELGKAGKKIMVFDVHNEHSDAIENVGGRALNALYAGINIFELDGMRIVDRITDLVSLFTDVFALGNVQSALLSSCLWYTYRKAGASGENAKIIDKTPTMADLMDELIIFQKYAKTSTEKQGLQSMRSKFMSLNNSAFNSDFITLNELRNSVLSFSLARLKNKEARAIYINEMLKRLYLSMKDNKRETGIHHYIMLDEAQYLMGNGNMAGELIKRLIEEGRKYGVGLIVSTHSASTLDSQIVANASTYFGFYSREPKEVDYVANLLGGGSRDATEQIRKRMTELDRHEALVMNGDLAAPLVIKTLSASEVRKGFKEVKDDGARELRENVLSFAHKVTSAAIVAEKFGAEGEKLLKELVAEGKIISMDWQEDGKVETWYMTHRSNLSIRHELHIRKMCEKLKALGVPNVMTVSGPNKPDLIAFARGFRVAIEYETGSKIEAETRDMLGRRSVAYHKVYVVVADEHYEGYLKYMSERVEILKFGELERIATWMKERIAEQESLSKPAAVNAGNGPA